MLIGTQSDFAVCSRLSAVIAFLKYFSEAYFSSLRVPTRGYPTIDVLIRTYPFDFYLVKL